MSAVPGTPVVWLHLAIVASGSEGAIFALLGHLGFRATGWANDEESLSGTYGRDEPISDPDELTVPLRELGATFAMQHMLGWTDEGGWQDSWRIVHVPGVGTVAGRADAAGRFVLDAEQVGLAVRAAGGDFATLAARLDELLGTPVVEAFDALWRTIER